VDLGATWKGLQRKENWTGRVELTAAKQMYFKLPIMRFGPNTA